MSELLDSGDFASIGPDSDDLTLRLNYMNQQCLGISQLEGDGVFWAVMADTFLIDDQSMIVVLVDPISPDARWGEGLHTTLYLHCNSTFTEGSYCRVFYSRIEIGSFTRSGSTFTYTAFSEGTYAAREKVFKSASRLEFRNYGTDFTVVLNDTEIISVPGSGVTMDASHRYGAVSLTRATSTVQTVAGPQSLQRDSFWLHSIALADYIPQLYLGSGAKMARTTAGTTTATAGGEVAVPHFTTTMYGTTDITSDPAGATFTVTIEGWYDVKLYLFPAAAAPATAFYCGVHVNSVLAGLGTYLQSEIGAMSGSWTLYLMPGDEVKAIYNIGTTTAGYFGSGTADGVYQNFAIALENRSVL